jgi:Arc/MetJ-type ribon-helix-helix transcriptional regulator
VSKSVTISFRLPKNLIEEIDRVVEQGMFQSRSDFVREAIRFYIIKLREAQRPRPEVGL